MAMNVGPYYAGGGAAVFPSDRVHYGSPGVREVDGGSSGLKFDTLSCPTAAGYAPSHSFDAALHGYQGQLHQQPTAGLAGFSSYGPFDPQSASTGAKTSASCYPGFTYSPCGQPSTYPAALPGTLGPSHYLHDANKFDSIAAATGNDVISQYGGRHFNTAAMMAAAAVATMGGQHHAVGPASCPTLPIYPWMRSMGAGMCLHCIDSITASQRQPSQTSWL